MGYGSELLFSRVSRVKAMTHDTDTQNTNPSFGAVGVIQNSSAVSAFSYKQTTTAIAKKVFEGRNEDSVLKIDRNDATTGIESDFG